MKIIMLAEIDYAASGHKLCDAINEYSEHSIEIWTGPYHNRLKHNNQNNIVTHRNRLSVQQKINEADIVHIKGDWPAEDKYMGLNIGHKPIIQTTSGSFARKKYHGGYEKFKPSQYKATVKTSFEPDLLYPEYGDTWTPHPINSDIQSIEWKLSDPPILMHTPTNRETKNSAFIMMVLMMLQKKKKAEVVLLEKLPFEKVLQARKRATIFFDQFRVGFYGNSALEAMQYGIPVAAWISPQARSQAKGLLNGCPVITTDRNVKDWVRKIEETLDGDMEYLSRRTKIWCDAMHSYRWVADLWNGIYNAI